MILGRGPSHIPMEFITNMDLHHWGLQCNFLIPKAKECVDTACLSVPCPNTNVVRIKSRRRLPDACVMPLPHGSTVQSAPLTPFPFTPFGLYRMPLPGRGKRDKNVSSRLGSHGMNKEEEAER